MNKPSSHTGKSSQRFYRQMGDKTGIKLIPFPSIPVKSPDASPMDFCHFGLLKRGLSSRRPRTIEGLWNVCRETWQDISTACLRRGLLKWKLRCRVIVHNHGKHIEQNRCWRHSIS
ncbi:hypothetical protein C0J52_00524 [Blattella germanica]|nr:hypothetical protein C0J52_00524 [Blattella germanica]